MSDTVVEFPARPLHEIKLAIGEDPYSRSLRDRAHQLAPVLWRMTMAPPSITWEEALQDPRMQDAMAKCLATAEMVVRLVDVINSPVGLDPLYR